MICYAFTSGPPIMLESLDFCKTGEGVRSFENGKSTSSGSRRSIPMAAGATIQSIQADLKPEAVYSTDDNGQRAGYVFLDMQDASEIPAIAEPWFLAFKTGSEIHPVMRPEDLAKAGGENETAVKKYA
jgi:hypothetical protein